MTVAEHVHTATAPQGSDLLVPAELAVPDLQPGATTTVRIPVRAGAETADGTTRLTVQVAEPFGHDAPPIELELGTRA